MAARKRFTVTLEVTSKDQSYPWVLAWLHNQSARSASTMQQHVRSVPYPAPAWGGEGRGPPLTAARRRA